MPDGAWRLPLPGAARAAAAPHSRPNCCLAVPPTQPQCKDGYDLDDKTGKCIKCTPENCATCDAATPDVCRVSGPACRGARCARLPRSPPHSSCPRLPCLQYCTNGYGFDKKNGNACTKCSSPGCTSCDVSAPPAAARAARAQALAC